MPRPISATIHTAALANNLSVVRRYAARSKVWTVVKANAYGHGLARAFPGLRGTDGFGLLETVRIERDVGPAGVAAAPAPLRLAVAYENELDAGEELGQGQ